MKFIDFKKVTIICDDALEIHIVEDLKKCGVKGYTLEEAKGYGIHSTRDNELEGRNIKIETIVDEETSCKIFSLLEEKYFKKLIIIAYVSDVKILRKEKFQ